MRQCIGGNGADTTAAVMAYLAGTANPVIRHLVLIGEPENPRALWMTDHEAPVLYPPVGLFQPANFTRGSVTCKAGLEIQESSLKWTPGALSNGAGAAFSSSVATANPLQIARLHLYDNLPMRIWKCFMPTPGDASTLGACAWFGGRVGSAAVDRAGINFSISSFLDVVKQKIPGNVVESTSSLAAYTAASFVDSEASQPNFEVYTGSTTTYIIADCLSPTPLKIYSGNKFSSGYMVFLDGPGATLAGIWSAIGSNGAFVDGHGNSHSSFSIYSALPWAPTPGVDKFYVSPAAPINQADGSYYGFPYVPAPASAV